MKASHFLARILVIICILVLIGCSRKPTRFDDLVIVLSGDEKVVLADLDKVIMRVSEAPLEMGDSELASLDFLAGARIVGMGEACYGSRSFFEMRQRIFRYMVEQYGCRAMGVEANLAETADLDRYITTGAGDVSELIKAKTTSWAWRTEELRDLLEWMKNYNSGKSQSEMIHYLGIDCRSWVNSAEWLRVYLEQAAPQYLGQVSSTLDALDTLDYEEVLLLSAIGKDQISGSLANVLSGLELRETDMVANSTQFEFELARQLVVTAIQALDVAFYEGSEGTGRQYRSQSMADNAVWLTDLMGGGAGITLWVHNSNVSDNTGGGRTMGNYLKTRLGDQYKIVGMSFSNGCFIARDGNGTNFPIRSHCIDANPAISTTNILFHNAKYENFMLLLQGLESESKSKLGQWMQSDHPLLSIGEYYYGQPDSCYRAARLAKEFDAIINIDATHASQLLN